MGYEPLTSEAAFTLSAWAWCPSTVLVGHYCEHTLQFFQVLTLEFRHGEGARVQGLDLALAIGHKSGRQVPVRTQLL